MKQTILIVFLVAGSVAGYYYLSRPAAREEPPATTVAVEVAKPEPIEPEIIQPVYRIVEASQAIEFVEPLPQLQDSDKAMTELLSGLVESDSQMELMVVDQIIHRVVATVDSLTSRQVAPLIRPLKAVDGKFAVAVEKDAITVATANYSRYQGYVAIAEAVDLDQLVSSYERYYPLFQEAYEALGYPDGYFNDRLVAVIDHLTATPDIKGPINLIKPEAFYLHADPQLESLSAGQKILIRMGPENAAIIKNRLGQIRERVSRGEGV